MLSLELRWRALRVCQFACAAVFELICIRRPATADFLGRLARFSYLASKVEEHPFPNIVERRESPVASSMVAGPSILLHRLAVPATRRKCRTFISRVTIGIRGRVSALQAHLMRQVALGPGQEEIVIKRDPALGLRVDLDHPALDPVWIKLVVNGAVERIGEVDAASIATDLDHLRATIEGLMVLRMRST